MQLTTSSSKRTAGQHVFTLQTKGSYSWQNKPINPWVNKYRIQILERGLRNLITNKGIWQVLPWSCYSCSLTLQATPVSGLIRFWTISFLIKTIPKYPADVGRGVVFLPPPKKQESQVPQILWRVPSWPLGGTGLGVLQTGLLYCFLLLLINHSLQSAWQRFHPLFAKGAFGSKKLSLFLSYHL